jgi:hypothetical protein
LQFNKKNDKGLSTLALYFREQPGLNQIVNEREEKRRISCLVFDV